MHIIAAIIGAAIGAAFLIYRIYIAYQVTKEVAEHVPDPRKVWRKAKWKRKMKFKPLDKLDDPREAGTLLMLAVAQADGEVNEDDREVILEQMVRHFQMPKGEAGEMLGQMAWMSLDMTDLSGSVRKLSKPLRNKCTPDECRDMLAMMTIVAEAGGQMSPAKQRVLDRYVEVMKDSVGPT